MDDYSRPLRLAQLLLEVLDLLELFGVVFTLWAVGNVDVGSDVVRNKAAGGCVRNTSEVIKGIVFDRLLLRVGKRSLMLDFN